MANTESLRTSISHVSSFRQLPVQSEPVCKLSHSPGLYHHNHQNGITKTTTAIGHFHFRKIIEKQGRLWLQLGHNAAFLLLHMFFLSQR